ncbi:MAG: acetate--CoA ligase family protein [Planctomycetaceae bacterium]|nr:acetate--CoA ligase family protein [Planctomycetaceae bacterium]
MKLYEFEGKRLFQRAGIAIPPGKVVSSAAEARGLIAEYGDVMVKAQVLSGRRGKANAVISCTSEEQVDEALRSLLGRKLYGETVQQALVEKKLDIAQEVYASVTYVGASPTMIVSNRGGMDVETACQDAQQGVWKQAVNVRRGLQPAMAAELAERAGLDGAADVLLQLYRMFVDCDATLAEINPLVRTRDGRWVAADAKVEIDEDAMFRQGHLNLPERLSSGRTPSRLEQLALDNDRSDTRGAAGRMFYELDGDIVVLASGGGTSVEALDSLCILGGKPAIFTEYSGNPTPEKVKGLTKIALMHPGPINAIWVVGGRANFTDVYETLIGGIMGGIRETPNFDKSIPILIRRAGPRDEEAFAQLNKIQAEEGYHLFLRGMATSVADSARMVIHQAKKHRERNQRKPQPASARSA